ncbi:hypothetical protein X946_5533 [Burkholderia sp. ABCPW 111]|nr:hypothetical protein X946_5533 [Burkholderia sp. ABCPW 111]
MDRSRRSRHIASALKREDACYCLSGGVQFSQEGRIAGCPVFWDPANFIQAL